jgi:C1A family cysteine protease
MASKFVLAAAAIAAGVVVDVDAKALRPDAAAFLAFERKFAKSYSSPEERAHRAAVFSRNFEDIQRHNAAPGQTWTKGVNKWTDLTGDEWRAQVLSGGKKKTAASSKRISAPPSPDAQLNEFLTRIGGELPTSVNWTAQGAVTPVKDQGQCGSCWAFATVGAIEGAWALSNKTLVSLSEQQIVSCDIKNGDGNDGCNGGEQIVAIDWVAKQPGLCTESSYPYTSGAQGKNGKCEKTCTPVVRISKGVELAPKNETILLAALASTPLSLSVDASNDSIWQSYNGGIVTQACKCDNDNCLDHGVTGVGYGVDSSGLEYWTIKNSWGADWGEGGYIRLARGADYNPGGQCGVQIDNAYAVI